MQELLNEQRHERAFGRSEAVICSTHALGSSPQSNITAIKKRRLEKLEERQAIMGISTPPEVLTEIEDLRREIGELEG